MARQSTMDAFLAATPSIPRKGIARSSSSESTLSCITLSNDAALIATDDSQGMSSSPPTSLDSASQASEQLKTSDATAPAGRSRRVRTSTVNYNENALSRSTRQAPTGSMADARRDLSGKTLVTGAKQTQEELASDSIQLLNLDWRVDVLPGERMELVDDKLQAGKVGRRTSLLKKATAAMDKSKTVLGKRTRDLIEAGKNLGRRSSLRPRDAIKEAAEADTATPEPQSKKRRIADVSQAEKATIPQTNEAPTKPPTRLLPKKIFVKNGLYVGQDQDFDARSKPSQKLKKRKEPETRDEAPKKRRSILPLPMFAGARLIQSGRDFKMPFDVFNPLPPGQPKPDEWRKTQRNVFVGDAAEYWRFSKNLEYSTCQCTPELGCDEDCFNRLMFYECDKNNCNIGPELCKNRSFTQLRERVKLGNKYRVGVEVIKTVNKGYGVRSCRSFDPGQIIVEYTGEIITQEECDDRMHSIYKDNECFYLMMFDQNMIIDATRGSIARFVNHSCEPNCRMVKWTVEGKPRMALFAGDNGINTGEELTYDYNFDPFSAKNIQECHCGSESCRGVLGPRPKDRESKEAPKPMVKTAKGTKRKIKAVVEKSVEGVKNKKRRLSADLSAMLASATEDRAARAALRANLTSAKAKGKRAAAKLAKRPVKKTSSRSVVSAKSEAGGKVTVKVNKKTVTVRAKANAASVRSNVVRTMKGAKGKSKGMGKSIKVVSNVYDVPDDE